MGIHAVYSKPPLSKCNFKQPIAPYLHVFSIDTAVFRIAVLTREAVYNIKRFKMSDICAKDNNISDNTYGHTCARHRIQAKGGL